MYLFNRLSADQTQSLARLGKFVKYREGETIYHQGEETDCIYIVYKGSINIFDETSDDGRIPVGECKAGAILDIRALLGDKEPRIRGAVANSGVELFRIWIADFHLKCDPEVRRLVNSRVEKDELFSLLHHHPFFRSISKHKLGDLVDEATLVNFEEGSVVSSNNQEQEDRACYIVEEGTLVVKAADGSHVTSYSVNQVFGVENLKLKQEIDYAARKIVASSDPCLVWQIKAGSFFKLFDKHAREAIYHAHGEYHLRHTVAEVKLFKGVQHATLKLIVRALKFEKFDKGTYIFKQGEVGDSLIIIKSGHVSIKVDGQY